MMMYVHHFSLVDYDYIINDLDFCCLLIKIFSFGL